MKNDSYQSKMAQRPFFYTLEQVKKGVFGGFIPAAPSRNKKTIERGFSNRITAQLLQ